MKCSQLNSEVENVGETWHRVATYKEGIANARVWAKDVKSW